MQNPRVCGGALHGFLRRARSNTFASAARPAFNIPAGARLEESEKSLLQEFCRDGGVVALTGAGLSTESGIPDYRSPDGSYSKGHKPILHQQFVEDLWLRKRYWARSIVGYAWFDAAQPNSGHYALTTLTRKGFVDNIITQNVDGLHYKAGYRNAIELHGANRDVECLSCGFVEPRPAFQDRIERCNKTWIERYLPTDFDSSSIRADGDSHLENVDFADFDIPGCLRCTNGMMKPTVIFFGGSLKPAMKDASTEAVKKAKKMLVVGTSTQVFSVYRLCLLAKERDIPIGIINIGESRCESFAQFKVQAQAGRVLQELAQRLGC